MIFKYKVYNNLLIELGRLDYVIELSEIAVKDFLNNLNKSGSPEDFLQKKSSEHNIMVSFDNDNQYYNQVMLGNISHVYHLTETFLYELQAEYNQYLNGKDKWTFSENGTKLEQVLAFFKNKNRFNYKDYINEYLIDTFNYYHKLRIYFSHRKTISKSEINKTYKKALNHYDDILLRKYRVEEPPKTIDNLNFEDYFLFTQISKDLALQLSSIGYPEPAGLANSSHFKYHRKYKDKEKRLINYVENVLKTEFGFVKENDSDNLVNLIIKYL